MNGINNEPFFKETKKLKRERIKWLTLLITTNLLTFLLFLPASNEVTQAPNPWPSDWPEIILESEVIASGTLPLKVTIVDSEQRVVFKLAYMTNDKEMRFRIDPDDLQYLTRESQLRVLPFSGNMPVRQTLNKSVQYEIHF